MKKSNSISALTDHILSGISDQYTDWDSFNVPKSDWLKVCKMGKEICNCAIVILNFASKTNPSRKTQTLSNKFKQSWSDFNRIQNALNTNLNGRN